MLRPGPAGSFGCVEARYESALPDLALAQTLAVVGTEEDVFTDDEAWQAADCPAGYVWGVNYALAYPGWSYVSPSPHAASWTARLELPMHEVLVETNVFRLALVFRDLILTRSSPSAGASGA